MTNMTNIKYDNKLEDWYDVYENQIKKVVEISYIWNLN